MTDQGYYRFPTIRGERVAFVCEDDLWTVPSQGGLARRLTSGQGEASHPQYSPDGAWIAFTGREEGHMEVYAMPAAGGEVRRLTHLGATSVVTRWSRDGKSVVFSSNAGAPFLGMVRLFEVTLSGGAPVPLPFGVARWISYGPRKASVLGRHGADPARWKRYRGGLAGDLWIDAKGTGRFVRLLRLPGNLSSPMWIGSRIVFLSDHQGVGNLYSCTPAGKEVRRLTHHQDFYVRSPSTDGESVVYHAGADLHVFDVESGKSRMLEIDYRSPRSQRHRRFVSAQRHLEDASLSPKGEDLAVVTRGRAFSLGNWEGAVTQHGRPDGARHRLARWLNDGKRIVAVTDEPGEEVLAVFPVEGGSGRILPALPIGRPVMMAVHPKRDEVALTNHRCEVVVVDLKARKARVIERSRYGRIAGIDWSPDGRWLAYSFPESGHVAAIKLWHAGTGRIARVTRPVLADVCPAFDPSGKYLYFLSYREFDPVYDNMHFDLGFPRGMRPYLVTLRKDLVNPFSGPKPSEPPVPPENAKKAKGRDKKELPLQVDLEGIEDRVLAFPIPEGKYEQIKGIPGKVLITQAPVEGSLGRTWMQVEPPAKSSLLVYEFDERKVDTLASGITGIELSGDRKTMLIRAGNRLRVCKAAERIDPKNEREPPSRRSGWIDLARVKVSVDLPLEWKQMLREAWRLQRDQFWTPGMAQVDWKAVYRRYEPLVGRIASRSEFSDLVWEMQGELGTSHCYEVGGDYRQPPSYPQGFLGADFAWDAGRKGYRVVALIRGDSWNPEQGSPLAAPGVRVKPGDLLVAIDGRALSRTESPGHLLVNRAGSEVNLAFADGRSGRRTICVKTLRDEGPARYRDWVESNRMRVHGETGGRVGYVHIPNMGPQGFAEFHRAYLAEFDRDGLIVDVRYNGGGHVSQLLLEKLARRRLGYDFTRWHEPSPYPADSVAGSMVAITNEHAGSDGDIFSHCFKLLKLGPLVGKRTWGGVVGIWPRHPLADGTITTQPEFSFWFHDVGFGVENYGTDPDIEVDISPDDYARNRDPQLERAISEIRRLLKERPPVRPTAPEPPDRSLPRLPPK
jgi:tricorn protease